MCKSLYYRTGVLLAALCLSLRLSSSKAVAFNHTSQDICYFFLSIEILLFYCNRHAKTPEQNMAATLITPTVILAETGFLLTCVDRANVWHYAADGRAYHGTKT
jgi:hypothetical protein